MSAVADLGLAADLVLALVVLAVAVWVIVTRNRLRAVIGFLVYGLLVALIWLRLGGADVALTEAAIGSGLVGLLLLGANARIPPEPDRPRTGWGLRIIAALLSAAVVAGLATVIWRLPEPAPSLAGAAAADLPATAMANPVTAVLMAFRAVDTLFETVVLVLALIAFWSLIPEGTWERRPVWLRLRQPSAGLVLLARVLPPFGVLVAFHLLWIGTTYPGGKFQAGALLAAMWALTLIAGLGAAPAASRRLPRLLVVLGPGVFLAIGLAGIWLAGDFLAYPQGLEKPLIVLIELVLMVSVALGLGLILAGLPPTPSADGEPEVTGPGPTAAPDRTPQRTPKP